MQDDVLFSEHQHWGFLVWMILLLVNIIVIFSIIRVQYNNSKALSKKAKVIVIISSLALSIFFLSFRLDTLIKRDGIYVRFFPIHQNYKKYSSKEIMRADVTEYNPMKQYGGWGIRGNEKNKAYTLSGSQGIQLIFINGNKLLIGTSQPENVKIALQLAKQNQ